MSNNVEGNNGGSSGRVTVKDVYDIMNGVATKVDRLSENLTAVTVNHESRLTGVEGKFDAVSRRVDGVESHSDETDKKVDELRDSHNYARGQVKVLTTLGGIMVALFGSLGTYAVIHFLHWG